MTDPNPTDPTAEPNRPRCPWCSAELPDAAARTCPSCQANLIGEVDAQLPGVNSIDLEKLAFRRSVTPKRSRILSWISGDLDYEDSASPTAPAASVAPPPLEVRREMMRLEMAAMLADLSAEAGALATEQAVAAGADPVAATAAIQAELEAAASTGSPDPGASDGPTSPTAASTVANATPSADAAPTAALARPRASRIPRRKPAPPA
jgi:hypothetical protein